MFSGRVLDPSVDAPPLGLHQVERSLHLVESVGVPVVSRRTDITIPTAEADAAEGLLADAGIDRAQPFAVLAPGASCSARRAKPGLIVAIAEHLARAGTPLVLVGGARDADATRPVAEATGAVDLTGRTSVAQLAAVIDRAAVAITMNSAPLHLADALGTPLVVLYSGTDLESQWQPRQTRSRVFRRPTDCSPCYLFESAWDRACLELDPVEIARAALAFVEPPVPLSAHTETAWTASAS
jgi:ADP-heptose:LPS heptosyltransferase